MFASEWWVPNTLGPQWWVVVTMGSQGGVELQQLGLQWRLLPCMLGRLWWVIVMLALEWRVPHMLGPQ